MKQENGQDRAKLIDDYLSVVAEIKKRKNKKYLQMTEKNTANGSTTSRQLDDQNTIMILQFIMRTFGYAKR
jgi:tRNA uridine 5-carbamoylmethylation protein Kti12